MKVCVYGAGAIGGHIAVLLADSGIDVSIIARGPHLQAIRANGLALRIGDETKVAKLPATDDPADLGPQDYVICTLKAHQLGPAAEAMQALLGDDTAVVTAMNGIPFWYFYGTEGPLKDRQVETVDPGGLAWSRIGPERVIGCVVYTAAEVVEPGVVQHESGDRYTLGEPDGSKSERASRLSKAMIAAGLKSPLKTRIRDEIWFKLWGNSSFNPVSTLTHATLDVLAGDPGTRPIIGAIMEETKAVGEKLGVKFLMSVEKRLDTGAAVGAHKTSMLQDLERGRPLELDALVTSVQELARLTDTPTPTLDMVLALAKQRARIAGLYDG